MSDRCGKRYGSRRRHSCARLPGHKGRHALRATPQELARLLRRRRRR